MRAWQVPWRSVGFPKGSIPISQHESAIILEADYKHPSLLEANIWGLLFYAYELADQVQGTSGIHLYSLLGHILVSVEHARATYDRLGFEGNLLLRTRLDRIRGVRILSHSSDAWTTVQPHPWTTVSNST